MNPSWVNYIVASKEAALVLSLLFNVLLCGAVRHLWKSREALQARVTGMLSELVTELVKLTRRGP